MNASLYPHRTTWAIGLGLMVLVALAFGEAGWFGFTTYDDPEWIAANPTVQAGLSPAGVRYAFTTPILGHWSPLTILSHMAAWQCFGGNAGVHHLVNVALQALVAVLLFLALRSLTGATWRSAAVAALFAVHPMRAESVLWITERKDVLSGVFFALTLWAYAGWVRRRTVLRYGLLCATFACGLMAKSMLITLPFVLLLLDFWPLQRASGWTAWGRRVGEKLPLFALSAASAWLQYRLVQAELMPVEQLGWIARLSNAVMSYAIYVQQLFWTGPMSVFYPHQGRPPGWQLALAAIILLSLTLVVRRRAREGGYWWVGWLWFLGMLVPVSGLVQSGEIARADRYTYLPHVGLLIVVVWAFAERCVRRRWRLVVSVAAMLLALLVEVGATRLAAAHWRSDETLWRQALAATTNNHHAHTSLGVIEANRGNYAEAAAHFREAVRIFPGYWRAQASLAQVLIILGDAHGAREAADRAVHLNPGDPGVHEVWTQALRAEAKPLRSEAGNLIQKGRYAEAIALHTRAMQLDPSPPAAVEFAQRLAGAAQYAAAATTLREALGLDPKFDAATLELASVTEKLGALQDAANLYQQVLARRPDDPTALAGLAQILTQTGQIDQALPLVEKALAKHPGDGPALYTLGTIRLMQGQSALAVELYRRALAAQPEMAEAQANLAWILATSMDDQLRNGAEAVRWATSATASAGGQNPALLRILAAAHAEAGQFAEALVVIDRAIGLAEAAGDANLTARLKSQREQYRQHQPLRVPVR